MSEATKKAKLRSAKDFVELNKLQSAQASQKADEKQSKASDTKQSEFANIESNPFYKILLNRELSPTQKKDAATKVLTFAEDKEESKKQLQAFVQFKEYLQFQRKRMAQQIISLTDTDAFSELQSVYQQINNALLQFEQSIAPLTELVDAVYTLRMNGVTFDAFREIVRDKEEEEKFYILRAEQDSKLTMLSQEMSKLLLENARLAQDRSWFSLGPIKVESREQIAENDILLVEKQAALEQLTREIQELPQTFSMPDSQLQQFAEEKAKLRELLDISSEDHKKRQEALVEAAQDFINKTESRVSGVLQHFGGMNSQIDRLSEANYTMREMYAILNDATKDALENNQDQRTKLTEASTDEGDIQKMQRERKQRDVENFIASLGQSHVDTTSVFADLTASGYRIKSMKDGNEQQIAKTHALHTSGVAGIADQLSTVLQAVSAAALGESSEMARMSLERMNRTTQELSQKEVIRVALGSQEVNSELGKALSDLEQYGEVIRTATGITREGLAETKKLLADLEQTARNVHEDVKDSVGIAADVAAGKGGAHGQELEDVPVRNSVGPDPFGIE